MKDINYFTVQSWMVTKLGLKGSDRDVFAIIYGFTQDNESECKCGYRYMTEITGYSKPTIVASIDRLEEQGLIHKIKVEKGSDMRNHYKCNYELVDKILSEGVKPLNHQGVKPLNQGGKVALPHNIREKEEINKKAPAEPALSSTKSRRRDMISRSTNTLVDDLESGKDIDKQTSEQKKERKKKLEEDKAKARINKTEFSQEVKDLLYQFFLQSYHSNSDRRMRSAKDLEGKFNQLRNLIEQGQDAKRIIQQSIDNNWNALYDLRPVNKTNKSHEASTAICKEPTEEELKAWKESDLHF